MEVKDQNILQLQHLSAGYPLRGQHKVLVSEINYSVGKGKIIALLGINGSGKSTLLKTITGWIAPLEGKCLINDCDTRLTDVNEMAQLVSLVIPQPDIPSGIDVYSLIALGRIPYTGIPGTLHEKDHRAVRKAVQLAGVEDYASRQVNTLSDGERQRVFMARALAQDTPLVIMDEPTAYLDIVQRKKIMNMMKNLAVQTGKTFLVSTHEAELSLEFADEFLVIHNRQLLIASEKQVAKEYFGKAFSLNE